jgi:hypothetical protein
MLWSLGRSEIVDFGAAKSFGLFVTFAKIATASQQDQRPSEKDSSFCKKKQVWKSFQVLPASQGVYIIRWDFNKFFMFHV